MNWQNEENKEIKCKTRKGVGSGRLLITAHVRIQTCIINHVKTKLSGAVAEQQNDDVGPSLSAASRAAMIAALVEIAELRFLFIANLHSPSDVVWR